MVYGVLPLTLTLGYQQIAVPVSAIFHAGHTLNLDVWTVKPFQNSKFGSSINHTMSLLTF